MERKNKKKYKIYFFFIVTKLLFNFPLFIKVFDVWITWKKRKKRISTNITYYFIAIIPGFHANFGKMSYWTLDRKLSSIPCSTDFAPSNYYPLSLTKTPRMDFPLAMWKIVPCKKISRNFSNKEDQKNLVEIKVINNSELLEKFRSSYERINE